MWKQSSGFQTVFYGFSQVYTIFNNIKMYADVWCYDQIIWHCQKLCFWYGSLPNQNKVGIQFKGKFVCTILRNCASVFREALISIIPQTVNSIPSVVTNCINKLWKYMGRWSHRNMCEWSRLFNKARRNVHDKDQSGYSPLISEELRILDKIFTTSKFQLRSFLWPEMSDRFPAKRNDNKCWEVF